MNNINYFIDQLTTSITTLNVREFQEYMEPLKKNINKLYNRDNYVFDNFCEDNILNISQLEHFNSSNINISNNDLCETTKNTILMLISDINQFIDNYNNNNNNNNNNKDQSESESESESELGLKSENEDYNEDNSLKNNHPIVLINGEPNPLKINDIQKNKYDDKEIEKIISEYRDVNDPLNVDINNNIVYKRTRKISFCLRKLKIHSLYMRMSNISSHLHTLGNIDLQDLQKKMEETSTFPYFCNQLDSIIENNKFDDLDNLKFVSTSLLVILEINLKKK